MRQTLINNCLQKGFTTIEFLVGLGVMVILGSIGLTIYQSLDKQLELETTVNSIISVLHNEREKTVASVDDSRYGAHFESDKYVSFKGAAYDALDPANVVALIPSSLELYDISFTGGADVVFERIQGRTNNAGSVKIRIKTNAARFREIKVLGSGHAGFADTVTPTGSRITDSRHLHFDLGWSIQSGVTMTLTFNNFPHPDVVVPIQMASYFNAGNTEFSWEGTVNVDGQDQTLKIHTHLLDAFDTVLSVRRDRRFNDKPLDIAIDIGFGGRDIVSYTAGGTATLGGWGGTMSEQ